MASNATTPFELPPLPSYTPGPQPDLLSWCPDSYLALACPVIAYWVVSMMFHVIDIYDLFPHYRLHTPAELLKRNHATRWEVCRDVILQQIIQTLVGLVLTYFEEPAMTGKDEYNVAVWAQRIRIAQRGVPMLLGLFGVNAGQLAKRMALHYPTASSILAGGRYPSMLQVLAVNGETGTAPAFAPWELLAAKAIYWVGIPAIQFTFGVLVVDTWQYFWHRAMHMNQWLYATFHSRHHRLYVPYAYGALYNHPFEGFLLDTLGTGLAYLLSGMTVRQSMWFFTCSTIKTVDDHCGYALPWDPIQHITSNNAGYHDIHHQSWGIKTNFSQPFFTFWDRLLGTMWRGGDVSARYEKTRRAAQVWYEHRYSKQGISGTNDKDYSTDSTNDSAYEPDPFVANAIATLPPRIPKGKATKQAVASRQQVLVADGAKVLADEAAEEADASANSTPRRSNRRKKSSQGPALKGLKDRVEGSLNIGVPRMESSR